MVESFFVALEVLFPFVFPFVFQNEMKNTETF
jgi:hypothetical protein